MPERILALSKAVSDTATNKVEEIKQVTKSTKMLALNAQIEAVRAGETGKGFAIVAQEVKTISERIAKISDELTSQLFKQTKELSELGQKLITNIRGTRLTDLALNMIEIIDRNLYERSCDVRWWATDSAVVQACHHPNQETQSYASKRLGVILGAYTVYLDLWIVNANGQVIANGRPSRYPRAVGTNVSHESWFKQSMMSQTGDDFAVADVSINEMLENRSVATYAAAIRENGESNGKVIGVLGIFFDWGAQSKTVVEGVRLSNEEKEHTRCLLLDSHYRVIAASDGRGVLNESFPLETQGRNTGNYNDASGRTIGFALTPGYETYRGLGWYGVIVQEKENKA